MSVTRDLYEAYPYPSPDPSGPLIHDTAFGVACLLEDDRLDGWEVLDLGCGTGHRLVPLALQYPHARFTGFDASEQSLAVARKLAELHGVTNVEFLHGSVPDADVGTTFDLVVSTGVLHHLPDPRAGLAWAADHLVDDGLLYLWFYGALGEHNRMLERELVHLLAESPGGRPDLHTVHALGLRLSRTRYGPTADGGGSALVQSVVDADAYLNPVVTPVTFAEVFDLCAGQALDWVAAFGVNLEQDSKLIDFGARDPNRHLTIRGDDLFDDPDLRRRYEALSPLDRVRVLELCLRPTGITVVAGRGDSVADCAPRVAANILGTP
ncbi:class I SAM-dependent methyltransferase [Actinophytocola sp. NPDC049390]|uniref:class I SAM-dependent methyltransferase n=1 Tax=Actinophytocola sp. NPDC049390 TaxID=3363894 RepID=UPI00379B8F09